MNSYLTYTQAALEQQNAYWTAKEISQQPESWQKTAEYIDQNRKNIDAWLAPILATPRLRVILTGAGTSAYVGESIAPHLSQKTNRLIEAISTTNLVSNPQQYLLADVPTLLISFGRSGNSPESVAAVDIVDQYVNECFHLVLTCNPQGELAKRASQQNNCYAITMPEETLDQSFAMTSSFSSMLVSALCIFAPDASALEQVVKNCKQLIQHDAGKIKQEASLATDRLVFLGSGGLQGIAQEAALKVLELTAGQIMSYFESPLGFRHGPKSIIDDSTHIIVLKSNDQYTKKYDEDLINELIKDKKAKEIKILEQHQHIDDVWSGLEYIVYCQIFAFYKSMNANITPDNPCPTGEVNRVVQGVTIYPL